MTLGNGTMKPDQLTAVQGAMRLANDAAADYHAALSHGAPGDIAAPAGAYRDDAMQEGMHTNPGHYNLTPGIRLEPVSESTHGFGECADIVPQSAVAWWEKHGAAYGFTRRAANDPNCFKHAPGVHSSIASVGSATAVPKPRKVTKMRLVQTSDSKTFYVINEETGKGWPITGGTSQSQQLRAEQVDRVLNYAPSLADLRYYAQLTATPAQTI